MDKEYKIGEVFKDPETGELLKCVDGSTNVACCDVCYYGDIKYNCDNIICSFINSKNMKNTYFIKVDKNEVKNDYSL